MRARVAAVPLALAVAALARSAPPAGAAPAGFHVAFTFRDPRIDEASGIALGRVSPGVAYVQNDSGDTNRFFAVNVRTGATAATITVRGAHNVDWEDIAVGPSTAGASAVWLADIGDNDAVRSEVDVYRVPEPRVRPGAHDASITTPRASEWRLRYPDGPVNAESFAVTPSGVGYLVTKATNGNSEVYRLPPRPDRHAVQTLVPIAPVRFTDPIVFGRLATGAAISADGRWLTVRTYLAAYLWRLRDGDVAAALTGQRRTVRLPLEVQGEGIAFDGDRIWLDSEGTHGPVYVGRFAILAPPPPEKPTSPPSSPTSTPTTTRTASTSAASVQAPTGARSTAAPGGRPGLSSNRSRDWLGAIALIAVLGVVVEYRRRRGRPAR